MRRRHRTLSSRVVCWLSCLRYSYAKRAITIITWSIEQLLRAQLVPSIFFFQYCSFQKRSLWGTCERAQASVSTFIGLKKDTYTETLWLLSLQIDNILINIRLYNDWTTKAPTIQEITSFNNCRKKVRNSNVSSTLRKQVTPTTHKTPNSKHSVHISCILFDTHTLW